MLDHGQRLDRFAEAHVVGEASAESPTPQELHPGITAPLVRAERALQAFGLRQFLERRGAFELRQQIGHPAGSGYAIEIEPGRCCFAAKRHADHVARCRRLRRFLLQEIERGLDFSRVHLYPLSAQANQSGLEVGQRSQFGPGDLLVAQRQFPIELDD